jgi:phosphoribosylformylglycinamidine synthase
MANQERVFSASVDLTSWSTIPTRALLFGEAQGRIVVSSAVPAEVERIAAAHGVAARRIGVVEPGDRPFRIRLAGGGELVTSVPQLAAAYHGAIPAIMTRVAVADDALAPEYSSTASS